MIRTNVGSRETRPARILIADDHELVRQGMHAILSRESAWQVCGEARTGREALALAESLLPDLLILDIGLPELNGLEVTRRVRARQAALVLIVSVHDAEEVVQEAIAAGASGYVLKADGGRVLADAVHAILDHGQFFSAGLPPAPSDNVLGTRLGVSEQLTAREREVLQLLAEGLGNKAIAGALGITPKTVETHRARIMAKLHMHSMSDLVRYAIRHKLIEP